mmetsp:Transcript_15052/g.64458  ORF Transcript_15052/g.64458 Transcript_15052/m.64458 type:complete len:227 (+) Transcript_15052:3954-4634(+)
MLTRSESPTREPRNSSRRVSRHMPLDSTAPPARRRCMAPCLASLRPSTRRDRSMSAPALVVNSTRRSETTAACAASSSTETPKALSVPSRDAKAAGGLASDGSCAAAFPAVVASAAASAAARAAFLALSSPASPPASGLSASARELSWLSCMMKFCDRTSAPPRGSGMAQSRYELCGKRSRRQITACRLLSKSSVMALNTHVSFTSASRPAHVGFFSCSTKIVGSP